METVNTDAGNSATSQIFWGKLKQKQWSKLFHAVLLAIPTLYSRLTNSTNVWMTDRLKNSIARKPYFFKEFRNKTWRKHASSHTFITDADSKKIEWKHVYIIKSSAPKWKKNKIILPHIRNCSFYLYLFLFFKGF